MGVCVGPRGDGLDLRPVHPGLGQRPPQQRPPAVLQGPGCQRPPGHQERGLDGRDRGRRQRQVNKMNSLLEILFCLNLSLYIEVGMYLSLKITSKLEYTISCAGLKIGPGFGK